MRFCLNGQWQDVEAYDFDKFSYEALSQAAGIEPSRNPTIVYSLPCGICGEITNGKVAPFQNGMIINVGITGNA